MPRQPASQLRFDATLNDVHELYVEDRIRDFNRSHSKLWEQSHDPQCKEEPIHIWVLGQEDEVVGGLVARTHRVRAWLEIAMIWVREDMRGRGIGREMMNRVEAKARIRDCLYARTSTSQYQAPGFYRKCGYSLYGKLEHCPPGDTAFYFWKDLQQNE